MNTNSKCNMKYETFNIDIVPVAELKLGDFSESSS